MDGYECTRLRACSLSDSPIESVGPALRVHAPEVSELRRHVQILRRTEMVPGCLGGISPREQIVQPRRQCHSSQHCRVFLVRDQRFWWSFHRSPGHRKCPSDVPEQVPRHVSLKRHRRRMLGCWKAPFWPRLQQNLHDFMLQGMFHVNGMFSFLAQNKTARIELEESIGGDVALTQAIEEYDFHLDGPVYKEVGNKQDVFRSSIFCAALATHLPAFFS